MGRAGTHQYRASHGRNNSMPHMVQNGFYGDIVLVIGGSGFLGHFLIKLLAERGENISEIRSLDIRPPPKDFTIDNPNIKLSFHQGNILNMDEILPVFQDVNVAIHTASYIETCNFPDNEKMYAVNVQGTHNVLNACQQQNVGTLIYTGSAEVGRGFTPREGHDEDMVDAEADDPNIKTYFPGYMGSKRVAEKIVLKANKNELPNGNLMHTIVLRPVGIYGEGDHMYVTTVLKVSKKWFQGFIPVLGSRDVKIDRIFVGNVAWAHVTAFNEIRRDKSICGQSYILTDDSPRMDNFTWMKPFLESRNIKLLPFSIPLVVIYYFWFFMELLVWLVSPLGLKIKLLSNSTEVHMCCSTCYYNGEKARIVLGYNPYFSYEESFELAYDYYSNLDLS